MKKDNLKEKKLENLTDVEIDKLFNDVKPKVDNEYFNIYQRERQAREQEIKDAPKFRNYIRLIMSGVDPTVEEYKKERIKEQKHNYYLKNADKIKVYQKEYREKNKNKK